jgi:hypothetical protein
MLKNLRRITFITIAFGLLVFLLTILDFAALHDIRQDYVSRYILNYLKIQLPDDLPSWTSTAGEWHLVAWSLYLRFLFLILNLIVLISFYRKVVSHSKSA